MKADWFRYLITGSFIWLLVIEAYAIYTGQYTISDLILEHIRMKYRVALLAFLIFHFLFEYPSYR